MSEVNNRMNTNKKNKKNKKRFVKKPKVKSPQQLFMEEVRKMSYQPFTYPDLMKKARNGDKVAGYVVGLKIRAGFLFKDDVDYLDEVLVSSKNPELQYARESYRLLIR